MLECTMTMSEGLLDCTAVDELEYESAGLCGFLFFSFGFIFSSSWFFQSLKRLQL